MARRKGNDMSDQNDNPMGLDGIDADEAALDARINEQTAQAVAANPWGEVVDIDAKQLVAIRGVTPELEAAAQQLASDVTKGIRVRDTAENKASAQVIRKLLSKAGFRTKIREGLFPVEPGSSTLASFLTLQAIVRTTEPATEIGVNQ
jgi:hypothetical protein